MKTVKEVIEGCSNLEAGATIRINGLVSSDGSVSDTEVTLLPRDGYREMQKKDWETINRALVTATLQDSEIDAAMQMLATLEKALEVAVSADAATPRGPQYKQEGDTPIYRIDSSPDAIYFLRLRREGPPSESKKPKGGAALAKYELTCKLKLQVGSYVHAVKLQDGLFESVEIL